MSSDRPDVIERRSDYPPHAEHALLRVMVETASQTGDAFFRTLVYNLAEAMQVRYAFLSECTDKSKTRVRTLAFWADGRFAENFEYDLKGTPCEDAVGGKFCFHPKSVQSLFPTDLDLVDLEAESYYGMPVCASSGEVLGLLAILDDRPMVEDKQRHAILSVLGAHAGTELERTRTEEALRTTAQRYRLLAENMTDVIWTADKDGFFTYMSPSVFRLFGTNPKDLIGVHFSSVMANQSVEFTKGLFENTVSGKGGPSVIEVEQNNAEGNPVWCEVSVVALRDSAGDFAGLQGITRDITVRKRAGDVLRSIVEGTSSATGEAFFRSLVQHLASALETDYAFVAELNESTSETVSTLAVWDGNDFGDDFVVDLSGTPCAMQSDESIHYIESAAHGKFAPESFIAKQKVESLLMAPLKDAAGTPLGVVAVMNVKSVEYPDFAISMMQIFAARAAAELGRIKAEKMQRSLEAQVQHAQKLESLGVLAGGIAHDFNNLLAAILGYASLSLLKLPDDSPLKENLRQIEIAAQRAAELTKQMLAYSGKGRFEIRSLDLSEQVGEIANLLKASISKKATLRYEFADDLPNIEADKAQIQQVVMNLITNASEALEDGPGTITMRTGALEADAAYLATTYLPETLPHGRYAFLEVSDDGCGMDAATVSRIFEPFFSTKFTGRGLGLAAVLGIMRGHKGTLKVKSEPGVGTTIRILFPVQPQRVQPSGKPTRKPTRKIESVSTDEKNTGRILVVDDEEMVRTLIKSTLEEAGYTVVTAEDGVDALDAFSAGNSKFDAVLLDLTMPRMNGEETFAALRRIRDDQAIVLLSGYTEQAATSAFVGKGLAGFLQKPFQAATLVETVQDVLRA